MLTTQMQIVALYGALNGLILLVLALLVVGARRKHKVLIGDGGNAYVLRAQRAHGNAAEYIPIVLILMLALAGMRASTILLHVVGILLTLGRVMHGVGLHQKAELSLGRGLGMVLTWAALAVAVVACLIFALRA